MLDEEALQTFLDTLDAAGEQLREVLDSSDSAESPSIQFYLDGCGFLEIGYMMVDQLARDFPAVFQALYDAHYAPLLHQATRGQISWGEALSGMPAFLAEYAADRVQQEIFPLD